MKAKITDLIQNVVKANGVPVTVQIKKQKLYLVQETYLNGGTPCLDLVDRQGNLYCTATVNFPDIILEKDEVVIKNWSEGEEIFKAMKSQGLIVPTSRTVSFGFVNAPICKCPILFLQ